MRLAMGSRSSWRKCRVRRCVAGEHDGQEGSGVEVGGGEDAQLGEHRAGDLLGLVDEQDGAVSGGLDLSAPGFAEGLEAGPAVVRGERDAEEVAELAVEVGQGALGPGEHADGDVGELVEGVGELAQGDGLAGAGIAGDQGEAAVSHQPLEAPAEGVEVGGSPQGLDRDVGGEGVPLQAQGLVQVGARSHDSSSGSSMGR